jgi:hypothetical protein
MAKITLLDSVIADVGDPPRGPLIRPFEIKSLGYMFSKNKISLRDKDMNYLLCEIVDADTKRPVSFSFLLSKRSMMGLVLPFPYEKYLDIKKEERRANRKGPDKYPGPEEDNEA